MADWLLECINVQRTIVIMMVVCLSSYVLVLDQRLVLGWVTVYERVNHLGM